MRFSRNEPRLPPKPNPVSCLLLLFPHACFLSVWPSQGNAPLERTIEQVLHHKTTDVFPLTPPPLSSPPLYAFSRSSSLFQPFISCSGCIPETGMNDGMAHDLLTGFFRFQHLPSTSLSFSRLHALYSDHLDLTQSAFPVPLPPLVSCNFLFPYYFSARPEMFSTEQFVSS